MADQEQNSSVDSLSPIPPGEQHTCSMDSLIVSDSSEDVLDEEGAFTSDDPEESVSNKPKEVVTRTTVNTSALSNGEKQGDQKQSEGAGNKRRRSRERRISISAGPTNIIAGVEVNQEGCMLACLRQCVCRPGYC